MFTSGKQTKTKYTKYIVYTLIAGVASLAVAFYGFGASEDISLNVQAENYYINTLVKHAEYSSSQNQVLDSLINEGKSNMKQTMKSIWDLANLSGKKVDFKNQAAPALNNGAKALDANVKWAQKSSDQAVDTKKLAKNFQDSAQFAAEVSQKFPTSYQRLSMLRQDLKVHHFDLSNTIHDVFLLAETTKLNLKRVVRKLTFRDKLKKRGSLSKKYDLKIWKYEIKTLVGDLQVSLSKSEDIVKILEKIQTDSAKTQDDLQAEILLIKQKMRERIEQKGIDVKNLEREMDSISCGFWDAVASAGGSCRAAKRARARLAKAKAILKEEIRVLNSLMAKSVYFDSLTVVAANLTNEATGLLDSTKNFREVLSNTLYELNADFTDDEIDDNLGDEDFANEYAEQFFEMLDLLDKECDRVMLDCNERKERLDNTLIFGHN